MPERLAVNNEVAGIQRPRIARFHCTYKLALHPPHPHEIPLRELVCRDGSMEPLLLRIQASSHYKP